MVSVNRGTVSRGGVTFVRVVLTNESSERRRVRLDVECPAAVWPPRRRGVPEAGWDDAGVTVTVAGGGTRGVGFATPASEADVTVSVAGTLARGSVDDGGFEDASASGASSSDASSMDGVVRALGGFAPPLAATPRMNAENPAEAANADDAAFPESSTDANDATAPESSADVGRRE